MGENKLWDKFDNAIDTTGLADDVKEAADGNGDFKEVPHGNYEVKVDKMELTESKKHDPMVTIWFKIVVGEYKNSLIFMNQVVTRGFQIHIVNEILRQMTADVDGFNVEFKDYKQYGNLIMDVFETISGKYEFELEYESGKNDFSTYSIETVYPVE